MMKHFVFVPRESFWLFFLKRDRNIVFRYEKSDGGFYSHESVITKLTDDEMIEAMQIHSSIEFGTFSHPAIEQFTFRQERNGAGHTYREWLLWFDSLRPYAHLETQFDHLKMLYFWRHDMSPYQVVEYGYRYA